MADRKWPTVFKMAALYDDFNFLLLLISCERCSLFYCSQIATRRSRRDGVASVTVVITRKTAVHVTSAR